MWNKTERGGRVCIREKLCEREREFSGLLQSGVSEIRLDSDLEVYLS